MMLNVGISGQIRHRWAFFSHNTIQGLLRYGLPWKLGVNTHISKLPLDEGIYAAFTAYTLCAFLGTDIRDPMSDPMKTQRREQTDVFKRISRLFRDLWINHSSRALAEQAEVDSSSTHTAGETPGPQASPHTAPQNKGIELQPAKDALKQAAGWCSLLLFLPFSLTCRQRLDLLRVGDRQIWVILDCSSFSQMI